MKTLISTLTLTAIMLACSAVGAQESPRLSAAFPAAHVEAMAGAAHFFEYDFGGIGPMVGVAGGFDPAAFFTVEARTTTVFASIAPLARLAHGRPGQWGGAYIGPRLIYPVSILLPGPGVGGTVGYEYRFGPLRAAIDVTAGYGFSELDYQMAELMLHIGWSFNPKTTATDRGHQDPLSVKSSPSFTAAR